MAGDLGDEGELRPPGAALALPVVRHNISIALRKHAVDIQNTHRSTALGSGMCSSDSTSSRARAASNATQ